MRRAAAFLLLFALLLAAPRAGAIPAIYSFGDSLTDRGNALIASGGAQPLPGIYADGRFSNGPVWVEQLAQALGVAPALPSLAGGTNFAVGGARTGITALTPAARPNDLPAQVASYLAGPAAPEGALFTVLIGANDIVFALLGSVPLDAVVPAAVANTLSAVAALATDGGARDLLVLGLPDLGLVPLLAGNPLAAAAASIASAAFNEALAAGLAALPLPDGTRLRQLDTAALLAPVIADPGAFGFVNATLPCFLGNSSTPGPLCSTDPAVQNGFLFFDPLHPTTAGHALLAQAALAVVPGPAALGLFLAGLAGLAALRRPRAAG